ncbi:UDP-galactose-4-epimerase [Candidatus Rubidus massiliensis]|nr:MAG: hypothetical protein BGO10_05355 [Chlamydia sp. 32-24]CDZ81071.1 UDP-galactose-4-epimerase [Candidatus Rubidus massiliensis]
MTKEIIVVTGCSGRIGTKVCQHFAGQYQMVGLDTVEPKDKQIMDYFPIDLGSDESVRKGFEAIKEKYGNKIVSVIHLAAYYSFAGKNPELYDKITVQGTRRILDAIKSFEVEQFIFTSTQLIYAPCHVGESITEESKIEPKWDYPLSKVKTEKIIHELRGNVPTVILRVAGCYDDECHSIPISNQIQRIYEHQFASRVYPGDITHGAPFLHFDDLMEVFDACVRLRKELPPETALIIGEETTLSYDQMQREIAKLIDGHEISTFKIPKWVAKIGAWAQDQMPFMEESFIKPWMIDLADDHYELDVSKAKQLLHWQPKHSIKTSLPKMVEFLKKDPLTFYRVNGLNAPSWLKSKYGKG